MRGIDVQRRARDRPRAQGRDVESRARIDQSIDVAQEGERVGVEMMTQEHRLGSLEVRVPREMSDGGRYPECNAGRRSVPTWHRARHEGRRG